MLDLTAVCTTQADDAPGGTSFNVRHVVQNPGSWASAIIRRSPYSNRSSLQTRRHPIELGCAGYARNLPDGRVEVLAVAEPNAIQKLIDWLWQGPPAAHVTHVEVIEVSLEDLGDVPVGFATG